ncbi:hypothetical protein PIB30_080982 [Stylosanthes scabra]|uniref:Uncharacterized protein n=1 Tax=Stylosanthes scabra TaxID=79078 RepID=A0ABU6ZQV8_9FABA|nr:hypothetical protein [Stylosanthes scabra]
MPHREGSSTQSLRRPTCWAELRSSTWEHGGKELCPSRAVHPPPVSWRRKPLSGFGPSRRQTSRFLTQHWRRCRGTLCQTLLMAEPQVNNQQSAQMQDGRTTSESGSNNGRQNGRNRPTSSRRPSPRRAVSQIPSPRRVESQIHIPIRDREHRSAYNIMGIVTGQLDCLDRLESNYARQREVEQQLRQEQAWRKATEEKLRKMEAELKKKEVNRATPHHSDLLSGDIMQAEVLQNFKCPEMALYDGSTDPRHHLSNFRSHMYLAGALDATRCKAFPNQGCATLVRQPP